MVARCFRVCLYLSDGVNCTACTSEGHVRYVSPSVMCWIENKMLEEQ